MKSLPGWRTKIEEISNGVYKVKLTDAFGRISEVVAVASDETIESAVSGAFDIEKQISNNWNKFLFDLSGQELHNEHIIRQEYDESKFGSWHIETDYKKITYDQYSRLTLQTKPGKDWKDKTGITKNDLTYANFITLICYKDGVN